MLAAAGGPRDHCVINSMRVLAARWPLVRCSIMRRAANSTPISGHHTPSVMLRLRSQQMRRPALPRVASAAPSIIVTKHSGWSRKPIDASERSRRRAGPRSLHATSSPSSVGRVSASPEDERTRRGYLRARSRSQRLRTRASVTFGLRPQRNEPRSPPGRRRPHTACCGCRGCALPAASVVVFEHALVDDHPLAFATTIQMTARRRGRARENRRAQ